MAFYTIIFLGKPYSRMVLVLLKALSKKTETTVKTTLKTTWRSNLEMTVERQIQCQSCGNEFAFSVEEQEFYQTKGFQDPRKCKPCRDAAKQRRGGGGGGGYGGGRGGGGGGGYGRPQRQLFDATCASCGILTQVPFQPNGSKPVYCRECYQGGSGY
jgi:CxxC-x17-CxxC domain-containing protein